MKTFKRVITLILMLIAVALAGGMIYLNILKTRAVPDYNAGADLAGLEHPVTVYRDSLGIPHIYADSETDLYRTVGYVMAQDRLWQMDLIRRITLGRLSEVLDPSLVNVDKQYRALQFSKKSEMLIARADPATLACIEAYCDGVNQYMDQHQKKLPFEFTMLGYKPDPWELVHTYNLIGYMHWDLASGWNEEMALYKLKQVLDSTLYQELIPDMQFQTTYAFPDYMLSDHTLELESDMPEAIQLVEDLGLQFFQGSNNWAVSGTRSKTGMPILSNDMHLGLMSPGIWYQMHLVVEGSFNITGVGFPCQPFIVAGHNEDIAWGWTNLFVDDTDFYLETINPEDSMQYLLNGQWKDMEIIEEEIKVKGMDEPEIRINRFTHRGPVISGFKGVNDRVISMRWQGNEPSDEFRSIHMLTKAKNWDEFRDAVSTFYVGQNCAYADRQGNIGLQTVGGVPIRKGNGIIIYPGDTTLYDWTGQVPFEELPSIYNPESGYVSSANNRTVDDNYPYYIGTWYAMPYRIGRIREMLEEKEILGTEDFKRMLGDQTSHFARDFVPTYVDALEGNTDGIYGDACKILSSWDYQMSASSSAALIFEILWIELNRAIFHDELGDEDYPILFQNKTLSQNMINRIRITGNSAWCDNIHTTGQKETFYDNIEYAFHQTVDTLSALYGPEPESWQWGELHKVSLKHPLGSVAIVDKLFHVNRGPYPIGGSSHTVCPYSYPRGQSFVANHGASQRHVFHTADWDQSLTVIPTGTSGIPASPHYLDQTELYINNKFHRDYFSREAVEAHKRYKAVFE